jgi:hypothetical protein
MHNTPVSISHLQLAGGKSAFLLGSLLWLVLLANPDSSFKIRLLSDLWKTFPDPLKPLNTLSLHLGHSPVSFYFLNQSLPPDSRLAEISLTLDIKGAEKLMS